MTLTIAPSEHRTDPAAGAMDGLFLAAAALLGLSVAAAVAGLLVDGIYTGAESTAAMFRGYDLVTVLVVAPALAVATLALHRRARGPRLVVTSLAAYLLYTDAYYLFGTGFNDLFLAHIATWVAAGSTLVLGLRALAAVVDPPLRVARPRARLVAILLGLLTAALAGMWLAVVVDNILTGAVPEGSALVETVEVVRLGIALDLALLVPLYATAVVLLWRGTVWGFVLAAVALSSGLLHQVAYLVAMPVQVAADVPGAVRTDPAEPVIVLVYVLGLLLLARARAVPRRADSHD